MEPGERIRRATTKKKNTQSWWCEYCWRDVMVAVVAVVAVVVAMVSWAAVVIPGNPFGALCVIM